MTRADSTVESWHSEEPTLGEGSGGGREAAGQGGGLDSSERWGGELILWDFRF